MNNIDYMLKVGDKIVCKLSYKDIVTEGKIYVIYIGIPHLTPSYEPFIKSSQKRYWIKCNEGNIMPIYYDDFDTFFMTMREYRKHKLEKINNL